MAERTRIAMWITELRPAGAERVVCELAKRLDRERFDVRVFSLTSRDVEGGDGAIAVELEAAGIPVVPARLRSKLDLLGVRRLVRATAEFRPDIVHAHLFHANLAARWLGRRTGARRILSTIHVVERRPLRLRRMLERFGARRDDVTVCVSEAVARHAQADLGVPEPRVIHNGIDLRPWSDLPSKSSARHGLGLGDLSGKVIGCVGRLDRQKGFDVLLRAFVDLPADVALVVAGAGPEESSLRELTRTLGLLDRVHYLGHRPDVHRVLAALDLFCMPSRWEGFGLALVEALAAGLPVVASAVDSIPELLGDAGVSIDPDDPVALTAAIKDLLDDSDVIAVCRRRATERAAGFGVESMVARYAALYDEVLR